MLTLAPLLIAVEPLPPMKSQLVEAEAAFDRFAAIPIVAPDQPRAFKESLAAKRKAFEATLALFSPPAARGKVGADAQCRIGELHTAFADAITKVPAPRGLTEEQARLFHSKLLEQATPLLDRAAETFTECQTRGDAWALRCAARLREMGRVGTASAL